MLSVLLCLVGGLVGLREECVLVPADGANAEKIFVGLIIAAVFYAGLALVPLLVIALLLQLPFQKVKSFGAMLQFWAHLVSLSMNRMNMKCLCWIPELHGGSCGQGCIVGSGDSSIFAPHEDVDSCEGDTSNLLCDYLCQRWC